MAKIILSPMNKVCIAKIAIKRKGLLFFLPIGRLCLYLSSHEESYFNFSYNFLFSEGKSR